LPPDHPQARASFLIFNSNLGAASRTFFAA